MDQRRSPLALLGVLMLALVVAMGMSAGAAEAKKKKRKKKQTVPVTQTVTVNTPVGQAVPDKGPLATDKWGQLSSAAEVNITGQEKFVTDVNVTLQTTGSGAGAANDLVARLSAPNGRTVTLFGAGIGATFGLAIPQSIGPWKMDDDTATRICTAVVAPPCPDPEDTLNPPFSGTSQPQMGPLSNLNWVPMKGTWTLKLFDTSNTLTSVFDSWALEVSGRAFPQAVKKGKKKKRKKKRK